MLFKQLRVHQIFGANTDVGKTIVSSILALGSASSSRRVFYLKPVSTGPDEEADDRHILRAAKSLGRDISTQCLVQYGLAASPHLAAFQAGSVKSDKEIIGSVRRSIQDAVKSITWNGIPSAMYVETAGGVHSPMPSGSSQADAYRAIRLPLILVCDSKLGGISSSISAWESLNMRGYDVDAAFILENGKYLNHDYLQHWFGERNVPLYTLPPPPNRLPEQRADEQALYQYYKKTTNTATVSQAMKMLDERHSKRIAEIQDLPRRASGSIWYPFVQHKLLNKESDITTLDSAHGDNFTLGSPLSKSNDNQDNVLYDSFDGSASWWTQGVGHAHPKLTAAASYAAGRYGHVIFPQLIHQPALDLAERLLKTEGHGWADRVFYSDNGSTGIEVALKMALRASSVDRGMPMEDAAELGVLGLQGSYHGDTIGAMDACEAGTYNSQVEWYKGRGYWFEGPELRIENGRVSVKASWLDEQPEFSTLASAYNVVDRLQSKLAKTYTDYIRQTLERVVEKRQLGALVLEPLVLGAGGMKFIDPLFQRLMVDVSRSLPNNLSLPVIFDLVFAGLGRLGVDPISVLGVKPDIAAYAKLLTGGTLPLAATLSSERIFNTFLDDSKARALLHGHSYTAYPVGCSVANTSLDLIDQIKASTPWSEAQSLWTPSPFNYNSDIITPWSLWEPEFVDTMSRLEGISHAFALGTVFAFQLAPSNVSDGAGYGSHSALKTLQSLSERRTGDEPSVHFRTLGDVGYFMTSLNTERATIRWLQSRILEAIQRKS